MQFPFAYQRNNQHIYVLLVMGALGIVLLGISMEFTAKLMKGSGHTNFWILAIGTLLLGLALLYFGIWYYRRVKLFYERNDWFGITIDNDELQCLHFERFKTKKWNVGIGSIAGIETVGGEKTTYYIHCNGRKWMIPAWLMSSEDAEELMGYLQKKITAPVSA